MNLKLIITYLRAGFPDDHAYLSLVDLSSRDSGLGIIEGSMNSRSEETLSS